MMREDRKDLRKMLKEMDELEEEGNSPLNSVQFGTQKVTIKSLTTSLPDNTGINCNKGIYEAMV